METTSRQKFKTVDAYISSFPEQVRRQLQTLRTAIAEAAPDAVEVISYNMPAIRQNGIVVYYAAYRLHLGFYPTASGIEAFKDELTEYKTSKGAIRFPIEHSIPKTLVKKIVAFRVKENLRKPGVKRKQTSEKSAH